MAGFFHAVSYTFAMSTLFSFLSAAAFFAMLYFLFTRKKNPLSRKRFLPALGAWLGLAFLSAATMSPAERAKIEAERKAEQQQQAQEQAQEQARAAQAAKVAEADRAKREAERQKEAERREVEANKVANMDAFEIKAACETSLLRKLKAPSTAKFGRENEPLWVPNQSAWVYMDTVDSQNSFGAMLRSSWSCVIKGATRDDATVETALIEQ